MLCFVFGRLVFAVIVEDLDLLVECSDRHKGGRKGKVALHTWGAREGLRRGSCHQNLSVILQSRAELLRAHCLLQLGYRLSEGGLLKIKAA